MLENLQRLAGVTDEEKATVEFEELGIPLGIGIALARIKQFPQPMGVIDKIIEPKRKQMLMRLYPEYRRLCAFAHGSAQSSMFTTLFWERSPLKPLIAESQRQDIFQREVGEPALLYSSLSVVQCACEIATLYPSHVELKRSVIASWNVMLKVNLLCRIIWEIRAKAALGVI